MLSTAVIAALGAVSAALVVRAPSSYYLPLGKKRQKRRRNTSADFVHIERKAKPFASRNKKRRP
nr:MAG TPA: hypothetical protein [Caudoviricetes sp.]